MINELLTNALKYAFPEGREGQVSVRLVERDAGSYDLHVKDDGTGSAVAGERPASLGMRLVHILVEDQLKGTVTIRREHGTEVTCHFSPVQYRERL